MATSLTQVTLLAAMATKLYTNPGTGTAKVATLNLVSQDPTKNPKVNVSYSSDSTHALNGADAQTWDVGSGAEQLVSLSTTTATKGKSPYGMNITEGNYGKMSHSGTANTGDAMAGNCTLLDPYYLINPAIYPTEVGADDASLNTILTSPAFAKFYSNDWSWWRDFNIPMEATTFDTLFGNSPSYQTDRDQGSSVSYYSRGGTFDPSIQLGVSVHSNGYMSIRQWYSSNGTLAATVATHTGDRSTDSTIYDMVGSSWSSYRTPIAMNPWSQDMHMDHGVAIFDGSNHTSGGNAFRLCNFNGLVRTTYTSYSSSPHDWIASNRGRKVKLRGLGQVRWLKYNPTTKLYYICIGQEQEGDSENESTGLYSFRRDFKGNYYDIWYNSDTGGNSYIDLQATFTSHDSTNEEDPFVKETGTNIGTVFSQWKMTTPARIGKNAWAAFNSDGDPFFSNDLVTWKSLSDHAQIAPAGALMYNEDLAGTTKYYLDADGQTITVPTSGFDQVDKAGAIELNTEIGRYERTGIIIPPGQSLYLENINTDTAVSVSLLTMDI